MIDRHPELLASVTSRFQLYLRVCADAIVGRNEIATQRIMEYVSQREPSEDSEDSEDILLFEEYLSFVHILAIVKQMTIISVSYTHLTLPTIYSV